MRLIVFKKCVFVCGLIIFINLSLTAQTHIAVPLENPIYTVIEQAQIRGLCGYLPSTRPYSMAMVLRVIEEILTSDSVHDFTKLKDKERDILEQFRKDFTPERKGFNLTRGAISSEHTWNDIYFSSEFGFGLDFFYGLGYYPVASGYNYTPADNPLFEEAAFPAKDDIYNDFTILPKFSFIGDLGEKTSYGLTINGFIGKSPRTILGKYESTPWIALGETPPYDYDEYTYYQKFNVFSEPLAYFPYTYKKKWDSFVFDATDIRNAGMILWPNNFSFGYTMLPELAGEFFNGHFMYRISRIDREWAGSVTNSSLILNKSAQPFLAFETVIVPFDWISFSSLTGVTEYNNPVPVISDNKAHLKGDSETFQNAFSIVMLELSHKKYYKVSFGSSVVWPKRFEIGYLHPLTENFLYQNNVGDYDNMALFLNFEGQYPLGLGKAWASVYIDEISFESGLSEKDRTMYAFQLGGLFFIPWMPFASVTLSYTKIEPYNYTHNRLETPWYGNRLMQTNYVSFGKPLGYYLPPNSDEILLRFQSIPAPRSMIHLQYQMIRHGADYGDRAVDGSSFWSELREKDRSSMMKYFLHDGAYQWMHIFKLGGEYSFTGKKLPFKVMCEIGGVYSFFTDTDSTLGTSGNVSIINTPQYPETLTLIAFVGIQIFPKY
jgi:hypothetical protein